MMEISDDESNNPGDEERMEEDSAAVSDQDACSESTQAETDLLMSGSADIIDKLFGFFERDEQTEAEKKIKRHFSWAVPYCYKLRKNMSPLSKDQPQDGISKKAKDTLFPILNDFIDKNKELTTYMQTLSVSRASLCGKVFKVGEPTYGCRDCGMDPTCVLCSSCFKQSGHKGHRYKISTSSGGGYCDCGDEEAWKTDKFCSDHQPVVTIDKDDRKLKPEELERRIKFVLRILLEYAYKLLTFELTLSVPTELEVNEDDMTSFPTHVKKFVGDELYCTVLYNDETHTFDTVISTLQRALECNQREAIDYATMIDREGRCVVKIDAFQQCYQAKQVIERYTSRNGAKPLKVTVMQSHVVAHQTFSLKVLEWIETLLEKSGAIRDIFADLVETLVDESTNRTMLEGIMLNDTKLWKSARTTWHHVLIAGMLKDYELKKRFATLFSRNYADMMKDFIIDDHDHPYSITSLSVQIFTVPTIAHFLIEAHDVIFTIMRTLMSECEQKLNSERKLEFDRGGNGSMLKRTNFVVIDLKYILTIPPTAWTDGLIKNFNRGMDYFLQLLCAMQEMDAVSRQTGNHMEYEPEWESAFNLQIKLQPVLTLSLEWLATNKNIFIRAFRYCLRELAKEYSVQVSRTASKEFANHAATCFVYDVSSEPVSVHLPLSRFFAGLYVFLEQYNLEFVSPEFQVVDKPVPEILMEPSLRTQVLLAQVHAGMWKRNGYSLLNQLYFYQNVRCRTDMMDKDIISLQIGASLIEANEFLIHVLNRFELFQWADNNFYDRYICDVDADVYKHMTTLVNEFLGLVINIFSARYVPGVGQVSKHDCVRKEIIQLLCIEPMTHSTLSKGLVETVNGETGLEGVIEEVAVFKKSNNAGQGFVYELKPEYYKEYDWHHYHYTREEMSRAEEKQRERKKFAKEPEFFPPPTLPPFTSSFNLVVNILKSDVLLQMIAHVLQRSMRKSKSFNDSHLRKALHLLAHGLNEEIARNEKEQEHFFQFCESCKRWNIFDLLDGLLKEPTLAQYQEMIMWIRKQKSKIRPRSDTVTVETEDEPMVQVSAEEEKSKRARLAAETRAKILAKMAAAQQKFMAVNADLFASDGADENAMCDEKEAEPLQTSTVALGPNQTPFRQDDESYVCILCKEEHALSINSKRFVLAAFIQRSTVLCESRDMLRTMELKKSTDFIEDPDVWVRRNVLMAPHVSSCGHIMHESCWTSHVEGVINKERRRPYRLRHPQSFDVDKQEWLCPMCDCICNAGLPMALPLHKLYPITEQLRDEALVQVLQSVVTTEEEKLAALQGLPKKSELSPDITMPPPLPKVLPLEIQKADLCERAKKLFPPNDGYFVIKPPSIDKTQNHSLSFRVYLTGMDIMAKLRLDCNVLEYFNDDTAESEDSLPAEEEGPFHNSVLTRKIVRRLFRRGLPAERLLEVFQGHSSTDQKDIGNWLSGKCYAKLMSFMERVYTVARDKPYNESEVSPQLHRSLWHSLAYTIMAAEAYHRDQQMSFFGENVPIRRKMGLKFLTRLCSVSVDSNFYPVSISDLYWLLRDEFTQYLVQIWNAEPTLPCMLELDAFGMLVFLTYLMPYSLTPRANDPLAEDEDELLESGRMKVQPPIGSLLDHHNLRLAFIIHVYQLIVSNDRLGDFTDPHNSECRCSLEETTTEYNNLPFETLIRRETLITKDTLQVIIYHMWALPRKSLPEDSPIRAAFLSVEAHLNCDKLWEEVSRRAIPFLRCCAKFYESMTGIPPPTVLEQVESRFEDLISYLDLPKNLCELFDCPDILVLLMRWSGHPSMSIVVDPQGDDSDEQLLKSFSTMSLPRTLRPLINLPTDYTDLINSVSLFKCVKCDPHDSRMPTMCLICGVILCSQSYCCQQELKKESMGACTYHAYFCGGGIGIFLRIRECRLFLLSGRNKGCHMLPPYLDEYGETDQGLRRGNPMTLSREKYDYFRKLWIQHAIPEEIARMTEHHNSLPTTDWVYL
ncbi:unnamed protein product [Orchesella dallaii]|uniref:E3 ubiquitin-protein ligase n=1 Tax=Orchesella dallaii TaxID=48710 RepID=A0ABP1R9H5_9HEXA